MTQEDIIDELNRLIKNLDEKVEDDLNDYYASQFIDYWIIEQLKNLKNNIESKEQNA